MAEKIFVTFDEGIDSGIFVNNGETYKVGLIKGNGSAIFSFYKDSISPFTEDDIKSFILETRNPPMCKGTDEKLVFHRDPDNDYFYEDDSDDEVEENAVNGLIVTHGQRINLMLSHSRRELLPKKLTLIFKGNKRKNEKLKSEKPKNAKSEKQQKNKKNFTFKEVKEELETLMAENELQRNAIRALNATLNARNEEIIALKAQLATARKREK